MLMMVVAYVCDPKKTWAQKPLNTSSTALRIATAMAIRIRPAGTYPAELDERSAEA
jgi:hypothetical protein